MTLALQAAPLLALLLLLGAGRTGPVAASAAAIAAALPAAWFATPDASAFATLLAAETFRGAWLALAPIAIVAGGLLFHAAVATAHAQADRPATPARIFAVTLPLGAFLESVTGFAVGAVFALAALRGMGIRGAIAGALALQSLTLVPWGGLGPGTALGGAMTGLPAQDLAALAAYPNAAWLILLAPLLWSLSARAGHPVPAPEKAWQLACLTTIGALLILAHEVLPFELAGIAATAPVAIAALWRADPPTDRAAALRAAAPYLLLVTALLAARLWQDAPALIPFAELPGFGPTHVAVVLAMVATGLLARLPDGATRATGALRRAARPALIMLLYVILGRLLAGSGAATGLATAAIAALGEAAPFAIAPLGFLAGFVTGSNVGANAALMPIQLRLGEAASLPDLLAPALHIFAGAAGAGMSIGVTAMLCGLLADGTRPAALWRLLAPSIALVMAIATATLLLAR